MAFGESIAELYVAKTNEKRCPAIHVQKVAEREGFEPSRRFRLHGFQPCSFDHSDIALLRRI